jgi:formyl-CoA transferase
MPSTGASVIKVEVAGRGDLARNLGASLALSAKNMGNSVLAQNAGKLSLTLNLKHDAGAEALRRLVAAADGVGRKLPPRRDGLPRAWLCLSQGC